MSSQPVKLPRSLRRYIRQKKAELRRRFGPASPQEAEFLKWVEFRREQKKAKVKKPL